MNWQNHSRNKTSLVMIWCLALAVILAGAWVRWQSHIQSPPCLHGNDAAQYAGAARDFVRTGEFVETTHSLDLPRYLPLGYPAVMAGIMKATGLDARRAGVSLSLLMGILLPLLVLLFMLRLTRAWAPSILAAGFCAFNQFLIIYSIRVMTDVPFVFLMILLCWGLTEYLARKTLPRFYLFCLGLGLVFILFFQLRVSSLYLLGSLPLVLFLRNLWARALPWPRLVVGILIFLTLGSSSVLLTSYRLYVHNGFWSLSPQIGLASAVGVLKSNGDASYFKLQPPGENTRFEVSGRGGKPAPSKLAGSPRWALSNTWKLVKANSQYLWEQWWNHHSGVGLLAAGLLAALALLSLLSRASNRHGRGKAVWHLPEFTRLNTGIMVLLTLAGVHFASYCLVNANSRYMGQLAPMLFMLYFTCMHKLTLAPQRTRPLPPDWYSRESKDLDHLRWTLPISSAIQGCALIFTLAVARSSPAVPQDRQNHQRHYQVVKIMGGVMAWIVCAGLLLFTMAQSKLVLPMGGELYWNQGLAIKQDLGPGRCRVVCGSWVIPYYAEGYGFIFPYAEDDPVLLINYLRLNQINYVEEKSYVGFGDYYFAVPFIFLLDGFADLPRGNFVERRDHELYKIVRLPPPARQVSTPPFDQAGRMVLKPDKLYLVRLFWNNLAGHHLDEEAATVSQLHDGDRKVRELKAKFCALEVTFGIKKGRASGLHCQYLAISTKGLSQPWIARPTHADLKWEKAVLYELISPPSGQAQPLPAR